MSSEPIAFRMQLKPGCEAEYERRHANLWPELEEALEQAGIYDYFIFLDRKALALFAVLRLRSDHQRDSLPLNPVMQRWWRHMAELMVVQEDSRPVEWPLAYSGQPAAPRYRRGLHRRHSRSRTVDLVVCPDTPG